MLHACWDDFDSVINTMYDNQDVKSMVTALDKDKYEEEKTFKECEIAALNLTQSGETNENRFSHSLYFQEPCSFQHYK